MSSDILPQHHIPTTNTIHRFIEDEDKKSSSLLQRNPFQYNDINHVLPTTSTGHGIEKSLLHNERTITNLGKINSSLSKWERDDGLHKAYRYGSKSIARSQFTQLEEEEEEDASADEGGLLDRILQSRPRLGRLRQALHKAEKLYSTLSSSSLKNKYSGIYEPVALWILCMILLYLTATHTTMLEPLLKPSEWDWKGNRNLHGRQCVMNLFIEKQPPDEFDPDYKVMKPKVDKDAPKSKKPPKKPLFPQLEPPKIAPDTYRTKGQLHVISRMISSVADSFRSNITVSQHLMFTGVRDGGHLAQRALGYWPPRGPHPTMLHVLTDQFLNSTSGEEDPLQYDQLEQVEKRFKGSEQVFIYDHRGHAAGSVGYDDDAVHDPDDFHDLNMINTTNSTGVPTTYPELRSLLPISRTEDVIVPYLHIDATTPQQQMMILQAAQSMFADELVTVVAIENTPGTDPYQLADFFKEHKYKTFFLGSRQISRIDHLCKEILGEIISHPFITPPEPTRVHAMLQFLNVIEPPPKKEKTWRYPPFFIAMPARRAHRQAMQIQHMYDLFGGYGGGGGQIKTANDRKAPGKK